MVIQPIHRYQYVPNVYACLQNISDHEVRLLLPPPPKNKKKRDLRSNANDNMIKIKIKKMFYKLNPPPSYECINIRERCVLYSDDNNNNQPTQVHGQFTVYAD